MERVGVNGDNIHKKNNKLQHFNKKSNKIILILNKKKNNNISKSKKLYKKTIQ